MKKSILVLAAALVSGIAFANPKGDEIMQKVHDVKAPKFSQSQVIMTVIEKSGAKEARQVLQYGKDDGTTKSVVMDFKGPASVAGTRFLQEKVEKPGTKSVESKFIYLPALKTTRRIATSDGSKAFMGTDATYDDMSTRDMDEDTHEFLREESKTVGSTTYPKCYVIEEKAVDPKSSQYSKKIVWVDDATMYPIYTELYDKSGKLMKTLSCFKIENHSGYDIPMLNEMVNVQTGHKTQLQVLKVVVDNPLPDRIFTQQFLSTGK